MYYNKTIEVWSKGGREHIGNGVYIDGEPSLLYKSDVDIQPYSSAEAKMDYGFDTVTTHTMFTSNDNIEIGSNIVKYDGHDYEVKEKITWDKYTEVLLERI